MGSAPRAAPDLERAWPVVPASRSKGSTPTALELERASPKAVELIDGCVRLCEAPSRSRPGAGDCLDRPLSAAAAPAAAARECPMVGPAANRPSAGNPVVDIAAGLLRRPPPPTEASPWRLIPRSEEVWRASPT
mmetsp:Transcript_96755/g.273371  ORF Transcript_96755/g.273371 Transcript_96755/m.273371 type:complete len:134 (+) Transcript_96755:1823-2224(+)